MIFVFKEICYLHALFSVIVYSFPVNDNAFVVYNRSLFSEQKAIVLENQTDKIPSEPLAELELSKIQIPKNFNLSQVARHIKDFGIKSLEDDQHIEGLPLDRYGNVNLEYHKEIFLGTHIHESFGAGNQNDTTLLHKKLEQIFYESDTNRDGRISKDELLYYLLKNVQQHIQAGKDENLKLFLLIDTNEDGKITWNEYAALYVEFHHMNASAVKYGSGGQYFLEPSDPELLRELYKIQFRWSQADNGGDNELNAEEFLEFRHPEVHSRIYEYMVNDTMSRLDQNMDKMISEEEFLNKDLNFGQNEQQELLSEEHNKWLNEQRQQFHNIDENEDQFLTREELLKIFHPMNRVHINNLIKTLFLKVDLDPEDSFLTLDEVRKHADVFADLHILDTEKVLHDEI